MVEHVLTEHLDLMTAFVPCSTLDLIVMVCDPVGEIYEPIEFLVITNLSESASKFLQLFMMDSRDYVGLTINYVNNLKTA